MIASLNGVIDEKLLDHIVIDVAGVGYSVYLSAEEHGSLEVGKPAKLFIYEHLREQIHDLFGFSSRDNLKLFVQLLDVNGVGPKMALNILSIARADEVRSAIAGGQVKFIQQANGVGKKVAERVVIELKDKVGLSSVDLDGSELFQAEASMLQDEAVAGLMALGYSAVDASQALKNISDELSTEERIKQALKGGVK